MLSQDKNFDSNRKLPQWRRLGGRASVQIKIFRKNMDATSKRKSFPKKYLPY